MSGKIRLTIRVRETGFVTETEVKNAAGYWATLSTTLTETFPVHLVARKPDTVQIIVRAE